MGRRGEATMIADRVARRGVIRRTRRELTHVRVVSHLCLAAMQCPQEESCL